MSVTVIDGKEVVVAFRNIPYSLLSNDLGKKSSQVTAEMEQIMGYYKAYDEGSKFDPEGSAGDYVASTLKYKLASTLIKKEARFLFGETPDIKIEAKGDLGKVSSEAKDMLTIIQDLIDTVLRKNMFDNKLIKAARDCFIGKRVAGMVNFNSEQGISIDFISSLNFIYDTDPSDENKITNFICYKVINETTNLTDKIIYRKRYTLEKHEGKDICYVEETLHDGRGVMIEEVTPYQPTLLSRIPVVIILNDGLLDERLGTSEIKELDAFESYYSKLSNGDIDSERKNMHPIRYTVDMDTVTTKDLSSSPGSYWDLASDENRDTCHPAVGTLESSMSYSEALDKTLRRIKANMYDVVDVPDVTLENLQGVITSGKAMKCIYWPLIIRTKEKMKTWGPKLEMLIDIIIEGAKVYPESTKLYTDDEVGNVSYEINIVGNYPLPEDEQEEKQMDISEVTAQTMSKKSYMKKWRGLTDQEVQEELEQMALERQILEDSSIIGSFDENPLDSQVNNKGIVGGTSGVSTDQER